MFVVTSQNITIASNKNGLFIYTTVLLSHKKEWRTDTYNMDEAGKQYTQWKNTQ